jgi:hypothetical protein
MRNIRAAAIIIGLLTTIPAASLAAPASAQSKSASPALSATARSAKAQGTGANSAVHATKGVVKFVNANKLVITRSPQYGHEVTFVLNPSTERVGNVKVGSTVDIRYHTEAKQEVATAVTVVHAKQPPSAPGSHQ